MSEVPKQEKLEETVVDQQKEKVILQLTVTSDTSYNKGETRNFYSSKYAFAFITLLQIRIDVTRENNDKYTFTLFVKTLKASNVNNSMNIIWKFTFHELKVAIDDFTCTDSQWQKVHEWSSKSCTYTINGVLKASIEEPSMFSTLYDDTELTDFELCGETGSVPVHKAVLAASSDVLRRMLSGDWKETKTGQIHIPGTTKTTLEQFKMYLYLHKIPDNCTDSDFQQLLLLAAYFMIFGLEQKCIDTLVQRTTTKKVLHLCEFALKNQMPKLLVGILDRIQDNTINVNKVRAYILQNSFKFQ